MARERRKELIEAIQKDRGGRLLIAYVTSTRPNHEMQIADDAVRLVYDHLEAGKSAAEVGVDLLLHSNGGSGTAPWRLVSLIRQYTKKFSVLVPHHAFSAGTLIALGANEIVMHRMGCLGPIDPSVANIFNPPHPMQPGIYAPISVEDVSQYFKMVKEDVGITHQDELVKALMALTDKIHPLAIGNVQRHHQQARLLARKLLLTHMNATQEHEIEQLIENLKSKLFFHGHPINRDEAKNDLKLKIAVPSATLEPLMWDLYKQYEQDLKIGEPFNPLREMELKTAAQPPPAQITVDQILQQLGAMAQRGLGIGGGVPADQLVHIAATMVPYVQGAQRATSKVTLDPVHGAYIESAVHSDVFKTDLRVERMNFNTPSGPTEGIKQEIAWQRWEREQ